MQADSSNLTVSILASLSSLGCKLVEQDMTCNAIQARVTDLLVIEVCNPTVLLTYLGIEADRTKNGTLVLLLNWRVVSKQRALYGNIFLLFTSKKLNVVRDVFNSNIMCEKIKSFNL